MTLWLWTELHVLFENDDGSLPEIRVIYADRNAIVDGYAILRGRDGVVINDQAYFWSKMQKRERLLDSVPNAAALVETGEAEPFHFVLRGIRSKGITLPDLGAFVFPGQLALDYRKGSEWNPDVLDAFFGLLAELSALDENSSLSLEDDVLDDVADRFQRAWRRYLSGEST